MPLSEEQTKKLQQYISSCMAEIIRNNVFPKDSVEVLRQKKSVILEKIQNLCSGTDVPNCVYRKLPVSKHEFEEKAKYDFYAILWKPEVVMGVLNLHAKSAGDIAFFAGDKQIAEEIQKIAKDNYGNIFNNLIEAFIANREKNGEGITEDDLLPIGSDIDNSNSEDYNSCDDGFSDDPGETQQEEDTQEHSITIPFK